MASPSDKTIRTRPHQGRSLSLEDKVSQRTAEVGVIGLGYVGLPTMVAAVSAGFKVTGIDINQDRVDQVNSGHSYIEDVKSDVLAPLVEQRKIRATTDYGAAQGFDVIVICVPTPVNRHKEPEFGPLQEAVHSLARHVLGEQLIVLQSTSFPGTTEEMILPQLQKRGRQGREGLLSGLLTGTDRSWQPSVPASQHPKSGRGSDT